MTQVYRVSLVLEPQPEGGYTVTSPTLPGLVTEGDTVEEALENARDALRLRDLQPRALMHLHRTPGLVPGMTNIF